MSKGTWTPLTHRDRDPRAEARRLADDVLHGIRPALREADFTDGALAHRLLVHELPRSVDRAFGTARCAHRGPRQPHASFGPSPRGPYGSGNPYADGDTGPRPFDGDGLPEPPHPPSGRGFRAGCGAFLGVCCTCRMCCA